MNLIEYNSLQPKEKLQYFMDTLSITNRTPNYYVNWEKIIENTLNYELQLTTLGYLIGKENIEEEARKLFLDQPDLMKAVPLLLASREKEVDVLGFDVNEEFEFYKIDFKNNDAVISEIEDYMDFMTKSGLLEFLKTYSKQNLVDYVFGVEVGLDTNARKNRSGTMMESILEKSVRNVADDLNLKCAFQVSSKWIEKNWGIYVPVDKARRKFDAAVFVNDQDAVFVFETNYYGGGGSKLKSVAGEFSKLKSSIDTGEDNVEFVWITDGQGWKTAKNPMLEAFHIVDHIYNLDMISNGYLYDLFFS